MQKVLELRFKDNFAFSDTREKTRMDKTYKHSFVRIK